MGVILWAGSGLAVFVLARLIARGRPNAFRGEALLAIATALLAGLVATALDFGGWNEVEWRAALFAGLVASTAIAVRRLSTRRGDGALREPKR